MVRSDQFSSAYITGIRYFQRILFNNGGKKNTVANSYRNRVYRQNIPTEWFIGPADTLHSRPTNFGQPSIFFGGPLLGHVVCVSKTVAPPRGRSAVMSLVLPSLIIAQYCHQTARRRSGELSSIHIVQRKKYCPRIELSETQVLTS